MYKRQEAYTREITSELISCDKLFGSRDSGCACPKCGTGRMLSLIHILRVRINRHYQEIMERDNFVTAEKVKNAFLGLEHRYHTLMQVFRQHNEDYEKPVSYTHLLHSCLWRR